MCRACKALCRLEEDCAFWTYREGFNRDTAAKDCFLKEGTPGRRTASSRRGHQVGGLGQLGGGGGVDR